MPTSHFPGGSGSGDIAGSIAATQIAFGAGVDEIAGSSAFTFDSGAHALTLAPALTTPGQGLFINATAQSADDTGDVFLAHKHLLSVDPAGGTLDQYHVGLLATAEVATGDATNITALYGLEGRASHRGTGTIATAYGGVYGVINRVAGTITDAYGIDAGVLNSGTGTITNSYGLRASFTNSGGGTVTNLYGLHVVDLASLATLPYYQWFDSRGVYRVLEDNSQAITALYNPTFAKYTPGAADFERIVQYWGFGVVGTVNSAYFGTEEGGTGVVRPLNILGSEVGIMSIPGTYSVVRAGGYKSSDGSAGATGTATAANTLTIKNGLVTVIA